MAAFGKYLIIAGALALIGLSGTVGILQHRNTELKESLSISTANEKALMYESDSLNRSNRGLQLTVEQLEYFSDSITEKLRDVQKELKIKDKNLKQMQYLLSEAQKKDTIVFRDTLFKDRLVSIDTLLGDKWYQLKLGLRYPSTIIAEPKFVSEKYVIVDLRKETINPPKKCFLARWFQKKHKVVEVNVIEKNPYIKNKQQRFIEIIK